MMTKQKVFSNTNDTNYNDYIKNKNGVEILKTIKRGCQDLENDNECVELKQFKNYNDFLTLTKSYNNYLYNDKCETVATKNIYESNNSFVLKNKENEYEKDEEYESEYEKDEEYEYNEENSKREIDICKELKNVLYPYGNYKQQKKPDFMYPYRLDMKKWCKQKDVCAPYCPEPNDVCFPNPYSSDSKKEPIINIHQPQCQTPNYMPFPIPQQQTPNYIPFPMPYPMPTSNIPTPLSNFIYPTTNFPNKCKTILCKKGLCNNCIHRNKNEQKEKCNCLYEKKSQHPSPFPFNPQFPFQNPLPCKSQSNYSNTPIPNTKQLKTGYSF
jgi:hypothetical protein